jgi:hypothetical protein
MNDRLPDRLTILRLMVLMAGLGVSLVLFRPREFEVWPVDVEKYREMYSTVLIGFSLPGVLYNAPARRRRQGIGSLLWLALSLGVLLLLPPAVAGPLIQQQAVGSSTALACMHYLLPLMCVWVLLAALLGRNLRLRNLRRQSAWCERFGIYLGLAWSVQGFWLLGDIYWDAFMK